ncbi:MAG: hypothetical protein AAF735_04585 [Myxococcota bacterium]
MRRIQAETGVHRETAAKYLKSADVPIREAHYQRPPKPASEVITGGMNPSLVEICFWWTPSFSASSA